jgi:hypothetical protein
MSKRAYSNPTTGVAKATAEYTRFFAAHPDGQAMVDEHGTDGMEWVAAYLGLATTAQRLCTEENPVVGGGAAAAAAATPPPAPTSIDLVVQVRHNCAALKKQTAHDILTVGIDDLRQYHSRSNITSKVIAVGNGLMHLNIKYDDLCIFNEPWMRASRGVSMLLIPGTSGEIIEFNTAPHKFWNREEFPSKHGQTLTEYVAHLAPEYRLAVQNKEDGAAIRGWWSTNLEKFIFTTLGTLNLTNVIKTDDKDSPTFSGLAMTIMEREFPQILDHLKAHPGVSFFGEIVSRFNQIVTTYEFADVDGVIVPFMFIGEDGVGSWEDLRKLVPDLFNTKTGLPLKSEPVERASVEEDTNAYMMKVGADEKTYGKNAEGCVGYAYTLDEAGLANICVPFFKAKRDEYKLAHRVRPIAPGSDLDLKAMQIRYLEGTFDDALDGDVASDKMRTDHIEVFGDALRAMATQIRSTVPALMAAQKESRGAYARVVNGLDGVDFMKRDLFTLFGKLGDETDIFELMKGALLRKTETVPLIGKLQNRKDLGKDLMWWNSKKI